MAYIVTAYIVTAYVSMAFVAMAYIVTAYIVMAVPPDLALVVHSHGLRSYGTGRTLLWLYRIAYVGTAHVGF